MNDYITHIDPTAERRYMATLPELRADEKNPASRKVEGMGIVYNSLSENFAPWDANGYYEIIEPGAARGLLNDEDIMILFNHEDNLVLARNKATADLVETDAGVRYSFEAPNTSVGNDLLENLRLTNIRKSSFAFTSGETMTEKRKWEGLGEINLRRIIKFKRLFDFSPVTRPAYKDTTVGKRGLELFVPQFIPGIRRSHEVFKLQNQ